jgi:hypothetical protein
MGEVIEGQFEEIKDRGEWLLVDAIATLSEVMRRRLETLERSDDLLLSALTTLGDAVRERLTEIERNQRLLLEAVNALHGRVEILPHLGSIEDQDRVIAMETEIREALRWTRPEAQPVPFTVRPDGPA